MKISQKKWDFENQKVENSAFRGWCIKFATGLKKPKKVQKA